MMLPRAWGAKVPAWALALIFGVVAGGLVVTVTSKVSAAMNPATLYGVAPKYVADTIANRCNVAGWNVVQMQWISPVGAPTATELSVEAGTTNITLQQNWITYRCKINTSTVVSGSSIIDKVTTNDSTVVVHNLAGTIVDMPYVAPNTTGHRTGVTKTFTVTGSFTTQRSITLTEASRGTITRSNGSVVCAQVGTEGNKPTTHKHDFDPDAYPGFCYSENTSMTLLIRVHVTVRGRIFNHTTGAGISGVSVATCGNATPRTNANGDFSMIINKGNSFCVRSSLAAPAGTTGPMVRPLAAGYPGQLPSCPAFSASRTGPLVNGNNYCVQKSYECQVAGSTQAASACPGVNYDRSSDTGYDIVYASLTVAPAPTPLPAPAPAPAPAPVPAPAPAPSPTPLPMPAPLPVIPSDKPYFEARGGDVVAGSSFAHEKADGSLVPCSAAPHNTNAGIVGWVRQPDLAGASGEYAAFAWRRIQDFKTSAANTNGPQALSFANRNPEAQVNVGSGMFGGMFSSAPCVDYWGTKPAISKMTPVSGSMAAPLNVASLGSGSYYSSTDLVIKGDSYLVNKMRVTIYVNGNVAVQAGSSRNGVTYGNGSDTNWKDFDEIPAFKLIAKGSIFVDAGVERLDGLYVAVPLAGYTTAVNSFGAPLPGTISTCATGFTTYKPADAAGMITTCGRRLNVFGSFAANQIWMLRTGGTIGSGVPAEVFQYGPEMWLISPAKGSLNSIYDAVIGLPPVL